MYTFKLKTKLEIIASVENQNKVLLVIKNHESRIKKTQKNTLKIRRVPVATELLIPLE